MGTYTNVDKIYGLDLGPGSTDDGDTSKLVNFLQSKGHAPKFCLEYDEDSEFGDVMEALYDYLRYQAKFDLEFYGENEYMFSVVGVRASSLGEHWSPHALSAADFPEVSRQEHDRLLELQRDLELEEGPVWYLCISRG